MKKAFLIALAGMMLFAFTQCGSNNSKESKNEKAKVEAKGTQEFQDNMELFNKIEKSIKDAQNCDELKEAVYGMIGMALASAQQEYSDEEKITEEETEKLEKIGEELQTLVESKMEELGCEKESYSL